MRVFSITKTICSSHPFAITRTNVFVDHVLIRGGREDSQLIYVLAARLATKMYHYPNMIKRFYASLIELSKKSEGPKKS